VNADRLATLGHAKVEYHSTNAVLTPASGFIKGYRFTLNPYSGCSFACDYCYARFFAPTADLHERWGQWVRVKENAAATIAVAGRSQSKRHRLAPGDAIFMSSVTGPCQPIEARLGLTRDVVTALIPYQPRLTVQTRSPIARRDIDLFEQFDRIRVNFSVPTDSEAVRLRYEPHAPSIAARISTAQALREAGVPIGICISPMLPMEDPTAFGRRIAALGASEYLATGFHHPGKRFGASTPTGTVALLLEDRWTRGRYEAARAAIRDALGEGRPLLDGRHGFAPP
jgi:DNA repair photolyase